MLKLIRTAVVGVAFATLTFSSGAALALGHVTLGKHSNKDIKNHCDAAGGTYYNSSGVYGCFGPGGDVTCSGKTKQCFGTCERCGSARIGGGQEDIPAILNSRTFGWFRW
jgi:hypothetical protein